MTTATDGELIAAARDLMNEYFFGLDARDFEAATRGMSPSVRCVYGGFELPPGRAAVVRYLDTALTPLVSTRHLPTGTGVVNGDGVGGRRVRTYALAYVVSGVVTDVEVQVRGLVYDDVLERDGSRWQVVERVHHLDWTSAAPALVPAAGTDPVVRNGVVGSGVQDG